MKNDARFSPDRVEDIRRRMPKGSVKIIELAPLKGEPVTPMTWGQLGLTQGTERKVA